MVNSERAKGHASTWGGAWLEFHDQNGVPYYYDFQEDKTSTARPATLRIAPPLPSQQATGKKSKGKKASVADLEVLSFKSWWNEAGASGLTKRNIDIYFNVESNNFQVVLDNADKIYTISHIQGQHGLLTAWDLHVNAKIDILGRKTTLMQANFATSEWLEAHADRMTMIKDRMSNELRKYDANWSGKCDKVDGRMENSRAVVKKGGRCLRSIMNDVEQLRLRLSEYRPALANSLAEQIPQVGGA
jgi:hypothetical protein